MFCANNRPEHYPDGQSQSMGEISNSRKAESYRDSILFRCARPEGPTNGIRVPPSMRAGTGLGTQPRVYAASEDGSLSGGVVSGEDRPGYVNPCRFQTGPACKERKPSYVSARSASSKQLVEPLAPS